MRKRSIFKAVSALAMAAIMTVGVSATAFAAELSVSLDFKAPDGSAVETTTVEGKTVYLLPHNSTASVASSNGRILAATYYVNFNSEQNINGNRIRALGREPGDFSEGSIYNIDEEISEGALLSVYRPDECRYEWQDGWVFELNNGQIDINNLPEYPYIEMTIYDQDGETSGEVYYYFKFAEDVTTTAIPATSTWASDSKGWWIQNPDGTYLKDSWYQSADGKWYYMGADGYMLTNTTTPDGFPVNADGVWVQ